MEYHDNGHVFVRTYKRVWRFERYFYSFDRIRLPRPITWWQLWYFVLAFIFVVTLDNLTFLLSWSDSTLLKYLVFPGVVAYYLSRIKYDGKTPHKWIYGQVKFWLSPKYYARYQKAEKPGNLKIRGLPTFRERYEIEFEKEKKIKRKRKLK